MDLNDYNLLRQILSSLFCPVDHAEYFCSEFRAKVQHSGENTTAFGHVLLQLGLRAYHSLPTMELDWTIIGQFINGLQDEQMCCHLQLQKPTT